MTLSVFRNINQFASKSKLLDWTAIFFARILPYFLVAFLFFYAFYVKDSRLFFYPIFSGVFARFVINEIVHLFYKRLRPARAEKTNLLIPLPKNYSFPSGHSSFFFGISFYLLFYGISQSLAICFIIFSCVIGVARVFCGVHWFRDILAGALAGAISAVIVNYFINII